MRDVIRVLVVEDSRFYRRRIVELLNSEAGIEVVGEAANGAEALEQTLALQPDLVTMDVEMPVMDGITALRRIMAECPTPVLMLSSLTTEGARATLDALDAGAVDFIPKRFADIAHGTGDVAGTLRDRIKNIVRQHRSGVLKLRHLTPQAREKARQRRAPITPAAGAPKLPFQLVAIATSTGGPVALQEILLRLPANFDKPILLIQHMPANFTPTFAKRLNDTCAIRVKEASDGDVLQPGLALLAPGGKQMLLQRSGGGLAVRIQAPASADSYRPCVDVTFSSIAALCGSSALAVVLTGMGADGREGARKLRESGCAVWAQSKDGCTVYGMPKEVIDAGLATAVLTLDEIGYRLASGDESWTS